MSKRWMTLLGVVAVLALATGGAAAYAQETDVPSTDAPAQSDLPPADDEGGVTLEGRGLLRARGHGTAVLRGGGHVGLRLDGVVGIVDHAGDAGSSSVGAGGRSSAVGWSSCVGAAGTAPPVASTAPGPSAA